MSTPSASVAPNLSYDPVALLDEIADWIYKLAMRRCRKINRPELIDDYAAELRARLWGLAVAGRYDPSRGKPTTWAHAVARTVFSDSDESYCFAVHPPRSLYRNCGEVARIRASNKPVHQQMIRGFDDATRLHVSISRIFDVGGYEVVDHRDAEFLDGSTPVIAHEECWALVNQLPPRERQVVIWRYGLEGERLTLEEAGDRLGCTKERVRQIQDSAMKHLRVFAGEGDAA